SHRAPGARGCGVDLALHVEDDKLSAMFERVADDRACSLSCAGRREGNDMPFARIGDEFLGFRAGAAREAYAPGWKASASEDQLKCHVASPEWVQLPSVELPCLLRSRDRRKRRTVE